MMIEWSMTTFKLLTTFGIIFMPLSQCYIAITVPPSAKQGSAVRLKCTADANRNNVVAWSKNGQLIVVEGRLVNTKLQRDDVNPLYTSTTRPDGGSYSIESNIMFQSVQKTDTGVYECGLYESDPRSGSSVVIDAKDGMLDVLYYPPEPFPLCQPRNVRFKINMRYERSVTLKCTSETGNPPVQLEWLKTTKDQITPTPMFGNEHRENDMISSDLTLTGSIVDDQNCVFTCTVSSESFLPERRSSCSVNINVVSPIRVSIYPNEVRTFVGETADFRCRAHSMHGSSMEDSTEIQWSTEPAVHNSSRVVIAGNTLQVKDVRESDNGTVVSCYALFEDRWFESMSVLYTYTLDQASPTGFSKSYGTPGTAWILSFFISGILLLITLVILIWVIFKYRNLKQAQSADFPNLDRKPIESVSQQQTEYRELRIKSVASPTYTDLKIRANNQVTDVENNEEYTYVDEPNGQGTRPVSTDELYDYADETEINLEGPRQPEYVNKPFKPNPAV